MCRESFRFAAPARHALRDPPLREQTSRRSALDALAGARLSAVARWTEASAAARLRRMDPSIDRPTGSPRRVGMKVASIIETERSLGWEDVL
jgi:hypothetical protein